MVYGRARADMERVRRLLDPAGKPLAVVPRFPLLTNGLLVAHAGLLAVGAIAGAQALLLAAPFCQAPMI